MAPQPTTLAAPSSEVRKRMEQDRQQHRRKPGLWNYAQFAVLRAAWPAYKRLLQRSTWPVLAGPWRGEVGFEFLYWEPFLSNLDINRKRLIPVTRAGAGLMYPAEKTLELFSMRQPRDVRLENYYYSLKAGELKQTRVTAWDAQVMRDAATTLGLGRRYHVLHPCWMFAVTRPFLDGNAGVNQTASRHLRYYKWGPVNFNGAWPLPEEYVAVRFYDRSTLPLGTDTLNMAQGMVKNISKRIPVVLLHTPQEADEHIDYPMKDLIGERVINLRDKVNMTADNNLSVLMTVLSRARAFVGTYGGLAQLALRFGVPSISFYAEFKDTAMAHRMLSESLATNMKVPFGVLSMPETGLLNHTLT